MKLTYWLIIVIIIVMLTYTVGYRFYEVELFLSREKRQVYARIGPVPHQAEPFL